MTDTSKALELALRLESMADDEITTGIGELRYDSANAAAIIRALVKEMDAHAPTADERAMGVGSFRDECAVWSEEYGKLCHILERSEARVIVLEEALSLIRAHHDLEPGVWPRIRAALEAKP
jgi:hypothetical protein